MAKKKINFTVTDGKKPEKSPTGRSFDLKSPIPMNLAAGQEVTIDLGVSADHPLFLYSPNYTRARGYVVVPPVTVAEGEVVKVKVTAQVQLVIDEGETICKAVPLSAEGYEVE